MFEECPHRCDGDSSAFTREQFSLALPKVVENELEVLLWANSAARPKVSAVNIIFTTESWLGISGRKTLSSFARIYLCFSLRHVCTTASVSSDCSTAESTIQSGAGETASSRSCDRRKHAHHQQCLLLIDYYILLLLIIINNIYNYDYYYVKKI